MAVRVLGVKKIADGFHMQRCKKKRRGRYSDTVRRLPTSCSEAVAGVTRMCSFQLSPCRPPLSSLHSVTKASVVCMPAKKGTPTKNKKRSNSRNERLVTAADVGCRCLQQVVCGAVALVVSLAAR